MSDINVNTNSFHIYDFGESQSAEYARSSQVSEAWKNLGVANIAHSHVSVADVKPRESWLASLQERYQSAWALTQPPPNWYVQRRELFGNQAARSFGSDHELSLGRAKIESLQIQQEIERNASAKEEDTQLQAHTLRLEKQRGAISSLFDSIVEITDLIRLVRGRMGQFLGG